jgi:Ion transport protein
MPSAVESIMVIFMMATGDPFIVWEGLSYTNHKNIGRIHWFLFVLIVFLLLLNLLIAMMGDTYAKVNLSSSIKSNVA